MKPTTLIPATAAVLLLVGGMYLTLTKQTQSVMGASGSAASCIRDGCQPSLDGSGRALSRPAASVAPLPATFAGLPTDATYTQFAERIHGLRRDIPQQEQTALAAWIIGCKPVRFSAPEWLYLANEVMDSLCHQSSPFPEWSTFLTDIARNRANDSGLRDYSIQHMVDRLQPMGLGEPCETDPPKREAMITAMRESAGDTGGELAGTALMGLHHILQAREYIETRHEPTVEPPLPFSADALRPLAAKLATAPETTIQARVTALQVCAERGYGEVLPESRSIARDPKQPSILRLSAIAAIGKLGNAADEALLIAIMNEGNSRLLKALRPALKKVRLRPTES